MRTVRDPDPTTTRPRHEWNGSDGGDCADCPTESMWRADRHAHDYVDDPLEKVLSNHLAIPMSDNSVLCLCGALFGGPVWHRRHVAAFLRATLGGRHNPFTEGPFSDVDVEDGA